MFAKRVPGKWPTTWVMLKHVGERYARPTKIEFAYSTFDVWPKLWEGIEEVRRNREARVLLTNGADIATDQPVPPKR